MRNSPPQPYATLPAIQSLLLHLRDLRTFLHDLFTFRQDQLNMARVGHVRIDTTMSTVGTTALLGCLVNLDMLDNQVASVQAFGICVRFGVLEETEEELGGLFGPAGFGDAELFALRSSSSTPSIPPHGHRLLMIDHIAQVCKCALELPAIDSLSGFAGVFEGDAEVGAVSAGGFALLDRRGCVADHLDSTLIVVDDGVRVRIDRR